MCGICGMVGLDQPQAMVRMMERLRHRGPDDAGDFSEGPAHLGMVRLAVIDLPTGHQPLSDEKRQNWVVFNGEIYNYRALRAGLQKHGHTLVTHSDTETIVHLYEEKGEACVSDLDGDFAFAVWDTRKQQLFAARDRLGGKPLYYWHDGSRFAFASELKALLTIDGVSKDLDLEALDAYLTFLYIPAPLTPFRSIRKLPPGCSLTFQDGRLEIRPYWEPPVVTDRRTLAGSELDGFVRNELRRCVEARLVSDVALGAFLSGGLDSSSVVAFMSQASSRPVRTFSVGFQAKYADFDELDSARVAAKAFGTDHTEFRVKFEAAATLPRVVHHMDEPFADSSALLTYLISKEARRQVTVALTGIGGDEVFGGYPRYRGVRYAQRYERLPLAIRRGLAGAASLLPESHDGSHRRLGWIKRFLSAGTLPTAERYLAWRTYVTPEMKADLYGPAMRQAFVRSDAEEGMRSVLQRTDEEITERVHRLDLITYLPDDLLAMADRMSMAHGLEVRVPFCDHRLLESLAGVGMNRRMAGGSLKGLLKRAMRGVVPHELLEKPKQGFMAPLDAWLRDDLSGMVSDLLGAESVRRRGFFVPEAVEALLDGHRQRRVSPHVIYALVVLELWFRDYVDA